MNRLIIEAKASVAVAVAGAKNALAKQTKENFRSQTNSISDDRIATASS